MTVWLALLRREWLEHRGGLGWAQLAVLTVFVLVLLLAVIVNNGLAAEQGSPIGQGLNELVQNNDGNTELLARQFESLRHNIALPFAAVYFWVAVFILLGSLYDERRDRTVLFWKSMPVSDTQTVLSKLIATVWLGPLVVIAVILIAQLFVLIVASFFVWHNESLGVGMLWANAGLFNGAFALFIGYFTQSFWSLPFWGWLLLVSSLANRVPILWALLTPIVPMLLEWAVFDTRHLFTGAIAHIEDRALPVASINLSDEPQTIPALSDILSLWVSVDMWLGILCGALFIAAAIYFRRRKNEL